jgi:hypothetical protein
MGYGDEIMASGEAKKLFKQYGKPVLITGISKAPRYSEMWRGLSYIVNPCEVETLGDVTVLQNGPQCRPYIQEKNWTREKGFNYTLWRARDCVGEIALDKYEESFAYNNVPFGCPFIVIEPNISKEGNPNKRWPWQKWQQIVQQLNQKYTFVQLGEEDEKRILKGVHFIKCPTFRHAAAVMKLAKAAILPEGGLHHVAGVFHIPAVVLFGGFISPSTTGYPWHANVCDIGDGSPCGKWVDCEHCRRIWTSLSVDRVVRKFKLLWEGILP